MTGRLRQHHLWHLLLTLVVLALPIQLVAPQATHKPWELDHKAVAAGKAAAGARRSGPAPTAASDLAGLLDLKAQITSDPQNFTGNWQADGNPCKFTRVSCDGEGQVTKVKLTSPEDIATMYPDSVSKRGVSVAGELAWPAGTYQLQQLQMTSLPCSPAFLELAGRLQTLRIANVKLQDPTLPSCWAGLRRIQELTLGGCGLTGTLPRSWGALHSLAHLDLSDNPGLSGTLPAEWGTLRNLSVLDLSVDTFDGVIGALRGPLPTSWRRLANLTVLDLWRQQVSGTLPPSWGDMHALQVLYLSNTSISGTLPPEWSPMTNLTAVHLTGTGVSGPLPSSWGRLPNLTYVELLDTNVRPPMPASWRNSLCWRPITYVYVPWHRSNGERIELNSVQLSDGNNLCQGAVARRRIVTSITAAVAIAAAIFACVLLQRRMKAWLGRMRGPGNADYDPVNPILPWEDERLRRRKVSFPTEQSAHRDE